MSRRGASSGLVIAGGADDVAINAETDARFWRETNYKPGRKLDPRIQDDRDMLPQWNSIHNAVIAEHHLTAELGGKSANDAVAEIDAATDDAFWKSTRHKPGARLNPQDPEDAQYIPEWLSWRYAVAQEYARNHAGPSSGSVAGRGGRRSMLSMDVDGETSSSGELIGRGGGGGGGRSGGVGGQGRRRREIAVDDDGNEVDLDALRDLVASDLRVGNALYHTVGERADALASMKLDLDHLIDAIQHKIGNYPGHSPQATTNPVWFNWYMSAVAPTLASWIAYYKKQTGAPVYKSGSPLEDPGWRASYIAYAERWQSDWSELEEWSSRINAIRDGAILLGIITPDHPAPAPLPTTIIQDIEALPARIAGPAGHVLEGVEIVVLAGIGLGAVYLITQAAKGAAK